MRLEGVDVVTQRLDMVRAVEKYGLTVTEVAGLWGVSRETVHKWRKRYEAEGLDGLADRSTRPQSSPGRIEDGVEGQIVTLRTDHPRWGPRRVRTELLRRGHPAPAVSTIQVVFERNGLKRVPPPPTPAPIRFARSRSNELWQTDAKECWLTDGTKASIISVLDDCTRYLPAIVVVAGEFSTEDAITAFDAAVADAGVPVSVLSDNGPQFTSKRHGAVSAFERHVWATGAYTLNGRGYHPQTQGKVERYHRTLGEWLEDYGPFDTIEDLDREMQTFRHHYNHERPHQAIGDRTPAEAWQVTERAVLDPAATADRRRRESLRSTDVNGTLRYSFWRIGLGTGWANTKVRVVDVGHTIEVRAGDELVRSVFPDESKVYLGTGRRPGRRPRPIR
jgi:transposase InsO family protein